MNFHQQLASIAPDKETVLTVGVFDGVHQGHRHLLRRLVERAGTDYIPAVLTFTNHPVTVLRPGTEVAYITSTEERVSLIKEQGIELVVPLDFTPELSQVTAADFTETLVKSLRMKGLVAGPDSALGQNREGDIDFLKQKGSELGFWVDVVDPLMMDGGLVKSRRIRSGLQEGYVASCARLLGRKYGFEGLVVGGDQRGTEMGFPTANLQTAPQTTLPGDGVYATWITIDGERRSSATSIGIRPHFGLSERLVEVFVLDFTADLYGQRLNLEFVHKLRDQQSFSSLEELIGQIDVDVAGARAILDQDRKANGA
jgi:riboflavin kinase/FMN adenylyltransferase